MHTHPDRSGRARGRAAALAVLIWIAAGCRNPVIVPEGLADRAGLDCSGDGAPGCTTGELAFLLDDLGPIPARSVLVGGVQGRITSSGLDLLEGALPAALHAALSGPDGQDRPHVCIDPDEDPAGVLDICPPQPRDGPPPLCDGAPGCRLDVNVDGIVLRPKDGSGTTGAPADADTDTITVQVQLDLGVGAAGAGNGQCAFPEPPITGCNGPACSCAAGSVPVDVDLNVATGGKTCELVLGARDLVVEVDFRLFQETVGVGGTAGHRETIVTVGEVRPISDVQDTGILDTRMFNLGRGAVGAGQCFQARTLVDIGQALFRDWFTERVIAGPMQRAIGKVLAPPPPSFFPGEGNLPGARTRVSLDALALLLRAGTVGPFRPRPLLDVAGAFDLVLVPGEYAESEERLDVASATADRNGVSFGVRLGMNGDVDPFDLLVSTPNPCVPLRQPPLPGRALQPSDQPFFNPGERFIPRAAGFAQNTIPDTTLEYDAAIGISEGTLDILAHHLFNAGLLCLTDLGLRRDDGDPGSLFTTALLADSAGAAFLPSLDAVTGGDVLPLPLTLHPTHAPDFAIGEGVPGDPLLRIVLDDFRFDVDVVLDGGSPARLFTASVSGTLGLNVVIVPPSAGDPGHVALALDPLSLLGIETALVPIRCDDPADIGCFSDLLTEPPAEVGAVVPVLLANLGIEIAGLVGPIPPPPAIAGFSFDLSQTVIRKVSSPEADFVGVFADLIETDARSRKTTLPLAGLGVVAAGAGRRRRRLVAAMLLTALLGWSAAAIGAPKLDVGRFSDVAAVGSDAVVVAYEANFGDLVMARVTPPATVRDVVFLDGVPPGAASGSRRVGSDPGPDVGRDPSVVVAAGAAHVAYRDATNAHLRYARVDLASGKRVTMAVDTGPGDVGRFAEIAIAPDGCPQIAYMAAGVPTAFGGHGPRTVSQLRFVKAVAAAPRSAVEWLAPVVIEARPESGNAAAVEPAGDPIGVGLHPAMALDGAGRTLILYHDAVAGDVRLATSTVPNGTTFTLAPADRDGGGDLGWAGRHLALAVEGVHHAAPQVLMTVDGSLVYRDGVNGPPEIVDDGRRFDADGDPVRHHVGAGASLVAVTLGGVREVFAVYQDGSDHDVVVARRRPGGWVRTAVAGNEVPFDGAKGFGLAIAPSERAPGRLVVTTYVRTPGGAGNRLDVLAVDLTAVP